MKTFKRISSLFVAALALLVPALAFAQEGESVVQASNAGYFAIAIAFGIGLAAFGGALGQARSASAALEGISRNPNAAKDVFVPMILGLAFIESLVLFTWVLMFLMLGRL